MGSSAPLGTKNLFNTPGAELPGYVRQIARELMKNGKSKSQAIQMAIGVVKNWAEGKGGVSPETRAKAAAAVAQWEKAKATARATPNKADLSNPVYAPGNVVLLAAAPAGGGSTQSKKAPAKKEARDGTKGSLPPGATGWKHGWIPVDDSGKAVGPAQKPAWLKAAEAKHKAAGGRTVEQINAEKLKNAQDARARKAAAPAKKAAAAAKHAKAQADHKKAEADRKTKAAARAKEQKAKAAERAATAKQKERDRQVAAAYKQALADRKAGRELSDQQRRVVAFVEAKAKKDQAKLRKVDVPGADGSKVAAKLPAKTAGKKSPLPKKLTPKQKAAAIRHAAAVARARKAKQERDSRYQVRSFKPGRAPQTRNFSNPAEGVNALEFSSSHPKGHLAFRYKHGWILINPAIPSRGRLGGGIAKKHGVKSGSVTHGHFEPHPSGKGKVFVPDRAGGVNSPAKLKAAHTKNVTAAPHEKNKYSLVAAQKDTGSALKPSTPSPEKVSAVSKDANAASAKANTSKSLQDAQVAAKKHADAFVQAKKAGDTKLAESHKANAQAWAKKANQIKQAEKASADAKKKYEAEQHAKAKEDAAKAEKAKADAEKAAAEKKAALEKKANNEKAIQLVTDADKLQKVADSMPDKGAGAQAAKAQQYKYTADKYGELMDHMEKTGLTVGPKIKDAKAQAEADAKKWAQQSIDTKKKANYANKVGADAFDMTEVSQKADNATSHKLAAKEHAHAAELFSELGQTGDAAMHEEKAAFHAKKVKEHENPPAAPKAQSKPDTGAGPGITAANDKASASDAIGSVIDELPETAGGTLPHWDDFLNATYVAKKDPSNANLAKLVAAQKALKDDGVTHLEMKDATASLVSKITPKKKAVSKGVATPPAKKAAAPAPEKPKTPEAPPVGNWDITLPGPGMFKDGNAIMALMNKPTTSPEQAAAKDAAVQKALAEFKSKHGNAFDPNNVEVDLYQELHGGGSGGVPQLDSSFFDAAKAAGYTHPSTGEDVTNGWKPPAHTRPALLSYTGSGYTSINNGLRGGNAHTSTTKKIDEAFAAAPGLDKDTVTIRKMSGNGPFPMIPPPMNPGDEAVDYGYGSTSKSTSGWSGNVLMEVRIPKGTKVIDVNHNKVVSASTSEQEVLLPRGTRYRVVSDEKVGSQRRLVVEVVNTGEDHPKLKS